MKGKMRCATGLFVFRAANARECSSLLCIVLCNVTCTFVINLAPLPRHVLPPHSAPPPAETEAALPLPPPLPRDRPLPRPPPSTRPTPPLPPHPHHPAPRRVSRPRPRLPLLLLPHRLHFHNPHHLPPSPAHLHRGGGHRLPLPPDRAISTRPRPSPPWHMARRRRVRHSLGCLGHQYHRKSRESRECRPRSRGSI